MARYAVFLLMAACGARTELGPTTTTTTTDASTGLCVSGEPPVAIASGLLVDAGQAAFSGNAELSIATDGNRIWLAQAPFRPLLWSIPIAGGSPKVDFDVTGTASVGPLSVTDKRLLFGLITTEDGGTSAITGFGSVSTSGGSLTTTTIPSMIEAFDRSGADAFGLSLTSLRLPISRVSLMDASASTFASPDISGYEINWLRATSQFLHVQLQPMHGSDFVDQRFDIATGTLHDAVPFMGDTAGPSEICGLTLGTSPSTRALSCLSDAAYQPRTLASNISFEPTASGTARILAVDANWVYLRVGGSNAHLSRFSLADGHEQLLMNGAPLAAASSGACVFALTWTASSSTLWRLSP